MKHDEVEALLALMKSPVFKPNVFLFQAASARRPSGAAHTSARTSSKPTRWSQMEKDELAAKPFGCRKCDARFGTKKALKMHEKASHVKVTGNCTI
jgi:hypothetical protein